MPVITAVLATIRKGAVYGLILVQSSAIVRMIGRRLVRSVFVREATPSELANVQSILDPATSYSSVQPDPAVTNLVAIRHRKVVGVVQLVRHPPSHAPYIGHWLFSLYILNPLHRGTGIGEVLSRALLRIAVQEGAPEVYLIVTETNRPAIRLYHKLGFRHTSLPGLEDQLEEEARSHGTRRITMVKRFHE